jgi:hypothetical protein
MPVGVTIHRPTTISRPISSPRFIILCRLAHPGDRRDGQGCRNSRLLLSDDHSDGSSTRLRMPGAPNETD